MMTEQTPWEIGQRIRRARKALGMSQDDLARAVGVRMQSIYRYEREGMDLKSTVAVRVARALNVPIGWLLTGEYEGNADAVLLSRIHTLEDALKRASQTLDAAIENGR